MANLFSKSWMGDFAKAWNSDKDIVTTLSGANFSSIIGYGFIGELEPRIVLHIDCGIATRVEEFRDQPLNWDLRASLKNWHYWIKNGFGIASLGTAVTTGKLKFVKGDYRQMVRNVSLAKPFLRHFELMQSIKTDYSYD